MIVLYVFLAGVAIWYFFSTYSRRKGKPIPGPRGLPLVGNSFELSAENMHLKLSEYAEKYGEIVELNALNSTFVCLNSAELVRSAFNDDPFKKLMNDRFESYWGKNVLYNSESIALYPQMADGVHTGMRKAYTRGLHVYGDGSKAFEDRVGRELRRLEKTIGQKGGQDFEFIGLIKRSLSNLMSNFLSGEDLDDEDPDVDMFWQLSAVGGKMVLATTDSIMQTFPFVVKFPGFYKKLHEESMEAKNKILRRYYHQLRDTYTPGQIRGFVDFFFEEQARELEGGQILFTDERIKNTVLETVVVAIQTSHSYLANTFLCLLNNPECQERIQKELDEVIGPERDPAIDDRGKCPYLEATILESARYVPLEPVGLGHRCTSDVEFHGYHVPEGSVMITNTWYIHHNEAIWGDPWTFRPERWLDESGNVLPSGHPLRKSWLTFGTGRRQCIGEQFARSRLFLYTASILKRFKLTATPGKCGTCDPRTGDFEISIDMCTKPFYCKAVKRD